MRLSMVACSVVAMLAISAPVVAEELDWKFVPFDSVIGGGMSYRADGSNVVVDGTAFREALGDTLSIQKIGNDADDDPIVGNFGIFAAFNYTDADGVFAWAQSIPNTPLAIELRAHTLYFSNGASDYFALDARDMDGVDYLTATFDQLGAWGCTEIAPSLWMDIAVDPKNSQLAVSIVIDGFVIDGYPDLDVAILPGDLDGQTQNWRASGFAVAAIPEPATMSLLAIGLGALVARRRKHS